MAFANAIFRFLENLWCDNVHKWQNIDNNNKRNAWATFASSLRTQIRCFVSFFYELPLKSGTLDRPSAVILLRAPVYFWKPPALSPACSKRLPKCASCLLHQLGQTVNRGRLSRRGGNRKAEGLGSLPFQGGTCRKWLILGGFYERVCATLVH